MVQELKTLIKRKLENKLTETEMGELTEEIGNWYLTRLQLPNEINRMEWVPIEDVLYIDRQGEYSIFVTPSGRYKQTFVFDYVLNLIEGHGFELSDRKILVNMNRVKKYDSEFCKVYFDEGLTLETVKEETISTTFAQRKLSVYRNRLGAANDLRYRPAAARNGRYLGRLLRMD